MCFQDFPLKGYSSLTPFAFSSYGKEVDGPSIEDKMEATCYEGWSNEIEGAFVFGACGTTTQAKWLTWGFILFQHQTDIITNIN